MMYLIINDYGEISRVAELSEEIVKAAWDGYLDIVTLEPEAKRWLDGEWEVVLRSDVT